ncbi:lysophospholipid acyltransferase family protein [Tabrizicola sp. YIM 78059]|uniref:lysophospholipid acyltransferase family protein n=1 Tax=Tabrizicola sp. YIM 78059 TaxID=2529861 RepID=UPI0010A9B145|nr:lysophospholipid acyltransferase family protein [Tabrizicola sp. YIM 78059]
MTLTLRAAVAGLAGQAISVLARFMTAPRAIWQGIEPLALQRVYFANHSSNADFVLLWTVLPAPLRRRTRPVAALDYWLASTLRAFIGRDVFNAVLIDRRPEARTRDPIQQMVEALDAGASLILFPEGKRNSSDEPLLPFKTGLYHLAKARPKVDLVPVWIANLNKVMPKGEVIPVPLICTLTFGAPIHLSPEETKEAFLSRASAALLELRPQVPA